MKSEYIIVKFGQRYLGMDNQSQETRNKKPATSFYISHNF